MDNPIIPLIEEAVLQAKIKVYASEHHRLWQENKELRKQIASLTDQLSAKSSSDQRSTTPSSSDQRSTITISELQSELALLKKQFDAEVKFNEFVSRYSKRETVVSIMSHKKFIIQRMLEDDVNLESDLFEVIVKRRSAHFKIQFDVTTFFTTVGLFIDDKIVWYSLGEYPTVFIEWEKFSEACAYWADYLRRYPNTTDTFSNVLREKKL